MKHLELPSIMGFSSAMDVKRHSEQLERFQKSQDDQERRRLQSELQKQTVETQRYQEQVKFQQIQINEARRMNRLNIKINILTALISAGISSLVTVYFSK